MNMDHTVYVSSPPVAFYLQDASAQMTVRISAWVGHIETNQVALTCTHYRVYNRQLVGSCREVSSVLCDDLGWGEV